jgi:hypothetical protein
MFADEWLTLVDIRNAARRLIANAIRRGRAKSALRVKIVSAATAVVRPYDCWDRLLKPVKSRLCRLEQRQQRLIIADTRITVSDWLSPLRFGRRVTAAAETGR